MMDVCNVVCKHAQGRMQNGLQTPWLRIKTCSSVVAVLKLSMYSAGQQLHVGVLTGKELILLKAMVFFL